MKKLLLILPVSILLFSCTKNNCKAISNPDCICTMEYNPVCGCNDKTYGNPCQAECEGIKDYKSGECK